METVPLLRPTLVTDAIRREILSILARSDAITVPTATAQVAASWTARRRRLGESPSAVQTAQALICQVGADLLDELAAQQGPDDPTLPPSLRSSSRCGSRSLGAPFHSAGELRGGRGTAIDSAQEGTMSEYVTWEVCTRCGLLAALGWASVGGIGGASDQILPVEFDCPTGCRLDPDNLVEAYSLAASRRTPEHAAEPGR